jgi:hypothetical protein
MIVVVSVLSLTLRCAVLLSVFDPCVNRMSVRWALMMPRTSTR